MGRNNAGQDRWLYERRSIEEAPRIFQSQDCLSTLSHSLAYETLYLQLSREACHVTRRSFERDEEFNGHKPYASCRTTAYTQIKAPVKVPGHIKDTSSMLRAKKQGFATSKTTIMENRSQKENPYPPPCVYPSPQRRRNPLMPTNSRPNGKSQ